MNHDNCNRTLQLGLLLLRVYIKNGKVYTYAIKMNLNCKINADFRNGYMNLHYTQSTQNFKHTANCYSSVLTTY